MSWTAQTLSRDFIRCVVGFDFREWSRRGAPAVATLDPQAWKRSLPPNSLCSENGLNLCEGSPDGLVAYWPESESCLVAFDLPLALTQEIASTFGITPLPIETVSKASQWQFLGFDVVDPRTQCSAFYSFDWSEAEIDELFAQLAIRPTVHGLVSDAQDAIATSDASDSLVPEHAPFAPCGVWVKIRESV